MASDDEGRVVLGLRDVAARDYNEHVGARVEVVSVRPDQSARLSDRTGETRAHLVTSAEVPKPFAASCKRIDGKACADQFLSEVRVQIEAQAADGLPPPKLAIVLVGDNPASKSYIKHKEKAAELCGVVAQVYSEAATISEAELLTLVRALNADNAVHGIIVQLPLPPHIDANTVTGAVAHAKDVDGFTAKSVGSVATHGCEPFFCPCTPKGCLRLLKHVGVPLRGKEAVVIGASNLVGTPMSLLLLREGATVTTCHIETVDVAAHARRADILVVAAGSAELVQPEWVKPGAVVIDVGINFVADASKKSGQRMVGDVASGVAAIAGHLTPVPGGVGPMTIAMLMENVLAAATAARAGSAGMAATPFA